MACVGELVDTIYSIALKDTLDCPICLEVYTTPRALTCLHTFCEACIHAHIVKSTESSGINDQICCPVCRVSAPPPSRKKSPSEWAKLLPMNYAILPILETIYNKQTLERYCDSCYDGDKKNESAVKYCSDCQQYICEACLDCHKRYNRLKMHSISDIGGITTDTKRHRQAVNGDFCELHADEAIKYFCEDHNMLLCSSCVIVSHRPCRTVTGLHEMGQALKQGSALKLLETELKAVRPKFQEITIAVKDNITQIEAEANELPTRIKKLQEKANVVFEDLYSKVLTQSASIKKEHSMKHADVVFHSESTVAAVEGSLIMLDDVKENGSNTTLFITAHKLEKQMSNYKEILDKLVSSVTFTHLELQLDKELDRVVNKSSHAVNVRGTQFTPAAILAITKEDTKHDAHVIIKKTYGRHTADTARDDTDTISEESLDIFDDSHVYILPITSLMY